MSFDDFLDFKMFITKSFMKIIYIIGAILITLGAFVLMIGGTLSSVFGGSIGLNGALGGLALLTLGNLVWRLICESIIVIFSIHNRLVSIDNKTSPPMRKTTTQPPPKKFCNKCGKQIALNDKFCSNCGKSFIIKTPTQPKPQQKGKPTNL